jgi:hypothetical protein
LGQFLQLELGGFYPPAPCLFASSFLKLRFNVFFGSDLESISLKSICSKLLLVALVLGANRQVYARVHHLVPAAHHQQSDGEQHGPGRCCDDCQDCLFEHLAVVIPDCLWPQQPAPQRLAFACAPVFSIELRHRLFRPPRSEVPSSSNKTMPSGMPSNGKFLPLGV